MRLSVIIPTHNRPRSLQACLRTLAAQQARAEDIDVVVVDDGSGPEVKEVVETEARETSALRIRYVRQDLGGLNVARNRGAMEARGEVLAYLDDDTLVEPGWGGALLQAFEGLPCAAVGGRVQLQLEGLEPAWLWPRRYYLAEFDLGSDACWIENDPLPVGANCAVRRGDFARIGGFHPGLDRIGGSLVSNGDTEFFRRLRSAGGRLRYEPAARVLHCVPADRLTEAYFRRRYHAQGVSDELLRGLEDPQILPRRWASLARDLSHNLPPQTVTVVKDLLRGRGATNARFFGAYWAGRAEVLRKRAAVPPVGGWPTGP